MSIKFFALRFSCVLFLLLLNKVESKVTIERLTASVELGEGPHWDAKNQRLYYVNINGHQILSYDPKTKKVFHANLNCGHVGAAVPVEGTKDELIAGCGSKVVRVFWSGKENKTQAQVESVHSLPGEGIRVNDGKCDPAGRFLIGTMGLKVKGKVKDDLGALYSVDSRLNLTKLYAPVTVSNGLAWSSDNKTLYYIDSPTCEIWAFDYDIVKGLVRNRRVIFDTKANELPGIPDGMTIDTDQNLWVAMMFGGMIIQVDPRLGTLLRKVLIPDVDRVSSVAFGGPNLDVLYVTTARDEMSLTDVEKKPASGSLISIKGLGVRGCPGVHFKFNSGCTAFLSNKLMWIFTWSFMSLRQVLPVRV